MTDHDHAEKIMRDLDSVMRGDTPLEDDALLDTARTLLDADFNAEIPLALRRPAILTKGQPKMMSRTHRVLRALLATAAVFVIAAAAVLTVPPLRAFAQDILRQIGIMTVTDAPTDYEVLQQPIVAVDLVRLMDEGEWHPITVEETESKYLWLAMIEGIPEGFDTVEYGFVTPPSEDRIAIRLETYTQAENTDKEVSLGQIDRVFSAEPIDYELGGAITEEITVNGKKAVWVSGFTEYPDLDVQLLLWEVSAYTQIRDDLLLVLKGRGLTKEEMLEIAQSVTLRDPNSIIQQADDEDWSIYTPRQVAAKVGFDVAIIREHPENFQLQSRSVFDVPHVTQIATSYVFGSQDLSFHQVKAHDADLVENGGWEFNIGDAPVEDVMVNGNPGVWIEGVKWYGNTVRNFLLWEQDGFSYQLHGNGVSRQDMFAAAESLKYIDSLD